MCIRDRYATVCACTHGSSRAGSLSISVLSPREKRNPNVYAIVPRKTTPASTAPRPPTRTASAARSFSGAAAVREAGDPSLTREGGVEGGVRWPEVDVLHERACFARAGLAVHADVFPFDRQRTVVLRRVEVPDDL